MRLEHNAVGIEAERFLVLRMRHGIAPTPTQKAVPGGQNWKIHQGIILSAKMMI